MSGFIIWLGDLVAQLMFWAILIGVSVSMIVSAILLMVWIFNKIRNID